VIRIIAVILCTFLAGGSLFAQVRSIQVEYTFKTRSQSGEVVTFLKTLKDNGERSLFTDSDSSAPQGAGKMLVVGRDRKKNSGLFIDRRLNTAYYYSPIFSKDFWVKEDSLASLLVWSFENSTSKRILDFECKSATCSFRGRSYIAYYTEEIPGYSGPWKFSGLPGLILEIATDDKSFEFQAYRFIGKNEVSEIADPYQGKQLTFIPFSEFKKNYLKKLIDAQNNAKSKEKDEDVEYSFQDRSMELLN
jgi:GLPGLI family protein